MSDPKTLVDLIWLLFAAVGIGTIGACVGVLLCVKWEERRDKSLAKHLHDMREAFDKQRLSR